MIGHDGCGLLTFTNRELRETVRASVGVPTDVDFLPFKDVEQSVRRSVRQVQESPLLPDSYVASGFVYDVRTGRLRELTSR